MNFWKWWSVVVSVVFSLVLGQYLFNIFDYILKNDITYISFGIMFIWALASVRIGYLWKSDHDDFEPRKNTLLWFVTDLCMGLGMVGTILGFMIILSGAFGNVDVSDSNTVKTLISTLATGMGTALLTTLVGLVASILLKIQLVMLEENNE